jgi:hypothetical protein
MRLSLRPWLRAFGQDLQLSTSQGSPRKLWRSYFRRWMSTSKLTTTSTKEGRKLTDSLKWPGASEEESIRGTSGQSTTPLKVMTKEVSLRSHNIPHNLRGNSKAPLGHQLQGVEAPGAFEEGLGISLEKIIAYSVVRTRSYYKNVPCHHSETKGNSRSRSPAELAEAGLTHCFVSLSLQTRVCEQSSCSFFRFG